MLNSPIRISGDQGRLRAEYFAWQIKNNPSKREDLKAALKEYNTAGYSLKQMRKLGKEDWKEIEVRKGLGGRLRDEIKVWEKQLPYGDQIGTLLDAATYSANADK